MSCNRIHKGDLDAYVHGELSDAEANALESHLFGCRHCATELRQLREEQRLFRLRAEAETAAVPSFADVLARIHGDAALAVVEAKSPRVLPLPRKAEPFRLAEAKHGFSRWAQAFVACAATAAAAWSFLSVTPPKSDELPIGHTHGEDLEIGADPICTPENSSASAQVLASLPPKHEVQTKIVNVLPEDSATCGSHDVPACELSDKPAEPTCDEPSSAICGESGP